jgi:hypothetical protein
VLQVNGSPTWSGAHAWSNLSIDVPSDVDWFQIQFSQAAIKGDFARIDFNATLGDIDLGLFDASGHSLASSATDQGTEQVGLGGLAAGTYYLEVTGFNGATNPSYTLTIDLPGADTLEPNNTLATAHDFGSVTHVTTAQHLSIDGPSDKDWFRFQTSEAGQPGQSVELGSQQANGDLDLALFDAQAKPVATSAAAQGDEGVSLAGLPAGVYYAEVYGFNGATNGDYTLTVRPPGPDLAEPNDTRATAYDLGTPQGPGSLGDLSVHPAGDQDWFRFQVPDQPVNQWASSVIGYSSQYGSTSWAASQALGAPDVSSYGENSHAWSPASSNGTHEYLTLRYTTPVQATGFSVRETDGNGFVTQVDLVDTSNTYHTIWAGTDPTQPGTPADFAINFAETSYPVKGIKVYVDTNHDPNNYEEIDAIQLRGVIDPLLPGHSVAVSFQNNQGDVDLALYDASGNLLARSAGTGDGESISLAGLPTGAYYAEVYGKTSTTTNPNYTLSWNLPWGPTGDYEEPNDSFATAHNLRVVQGDRVWPNLSIHAAANDDWYAFQTTGTGVSGDLARIDFSDALGDLDFQLYDASDNLIRGSYGVGDREEIGLAGQPAGTYYLHVYGFLGHTNPNYTLTIDAPQPLAPDWAEPNNSPSTAYNLRTVNGQEVWTGLSLDQSSDVDWYNFTLDQIASTQHDVRLDFNAALGSVDMILYDNQGYRVGLSSNSGNEQQIALDGFKPGTYSLAVFGAANPAYTLTIDAPPRLVRDRFEPNDDSLHATDLGTIQGQESWDGLSLHVAGDVDWFTFRTTDVGYLGNQVTVSFDNALGNVDALLYDSTGKIIGKSRTDNSFEVLSLRGLAAGVYQIAVFGKYVNTTSPNYSLSINAPRSLAPDWAEPNDSLLTATNLGTVQGRQVWSGLSIAPAGDADWFQIQTTEPSVSGDKVRIEFQQGLGDLDLNLYNGAGVLLQASATANDYEQISLAGLATGTYFVQVVGYLGATNRDYTLSLIAPGGTGLGDPFEPNDRLDVAADLGILQGDRTWNDPVNPLSIDNGNDVDWFKFQTLALGTPINTVTITFDNALGDLDLELCDATGAVLQASNSATNQERVSLNGRSAGNYYLHVFGVDGASNPRYALEINAPNPPSGDLYEPNNTQATATNLYGLQGQKSWPDLTITPGDVDWFQFTTVAAATIGSAAWIDFYDWLGDLDLAIYDAKGNLIRSSATGSDRESVPLDGLAAGTYALRVQGSSASVANPSYMLTISAPRAAVPDWAETQESYDDNNIRERATILSLIEGTQTWDDPLNPLSIHPLAQPVDANAMGEWATSDLDYSSQAGSDDWAAYQALFAPNTSQYGDSRSAWAPASKDGTQEYLTLGFRVPLYASGVTVRESDGNGFVTRVDVLDTTNTYHTLWTGTDSSQPGGLVDFSINFTQTTYLVQGVKIYVDTNHAQGEWEEIDAVKLRGVVDTTPHMISSDEDWFQFDTIATGLSGQGASITYNLADGDLDLELYNAQGDLLERSAHASNGETVSLAGRPAGSYYLHVLGYNAATNPHYALTISAPASPVGDWAEPDDSFATAQDLRTVTGDRIVTNLSIHQSGDVDWYRFTTTAPGGRYNFALITFNPSSGGLVFQLFDSNDTLLQTDSNATGTEQVDLSGRPAGSYYLRVAGYAGATNPDYTLAIHAPDTATGDRFEPNDTFATATDLRQVEGPQEWDDLTIHVTGNDDWFKFQTLATGVAGDLVGVAADPTKGELDVALYDANDNLLASTATANLANGFQWISLQGRAAGVYYVRVFGHDGAVSPSYNLLVDAPHPLADGIPADWAGADGSFATARDLQQVTGLESSGGLSIASPNGEEWFKFQTVASGVAGQLVRIDFFNVQGNLDLQLYDHNDTLLATSATTNDGEAISLVNLPAGTYYARVYGLGGATNPSYTLTINAPALPPVSGDWAEHHNGLSDDDSLAHAFDLRELTSSLELDGLSIHPAGDVDWYRFVLTSAGVAGETARIDFDNTQGNLNLALYDVNGQLLGNSVSTSQNFEQISLEDREAGVYYVVVSGASASVSNPNYTLSFIVPATAGATGDWAEHSDGSANNNSASTAFDLRGLENLVQTASSRPFDSNGNPIATEGLGGSGFSAVGGWSFAGQAGDIVNYQGTAAGYNPNGYREFFGQNTPLFNSGLDSNILAAGNAGNYAGSLADVTDSVMTGLGTAFVVPGLILPGDALSTALNGVPSLESNLYPSQGLQGIGLPNQPLPPSSFDADQAQYNNISNQVTNLLSSQQATLQPSTGFVQTPNQFNSLLAPPLQQIQVQQQQQQEQQQLTPVQRLLLGLPAQQPVTSTLQRQQTFQQPERTSAKQAIQDLGFALVFGLLLKALTTKDGSMGPAAVLPNLSITPNDEDWFQFQLDTDGAPTDYIRIDFNQDLGGLDLDLFDANHTLIDRANGAGDSEQVSLAGLSAGTYYVRVYGGPNPNYSLSLNFHLTPDPQGDWAEPNDTQAKAHDLRTVQGSEMLTNLSISSSTDQDWFAFTTTATGRTGDLARIDFSNDQGDLDLALYNSSGALLASSTTVDDFEQVNLAGLSAGTYYLEVYGYEGATNAQYTLSLRAPETSVNPDPLEPNNAPNLATDLGKGGGSISLPELTITPGDADYFKLTTDATGTAASHVGISFLNAQGDLQLALFDGSLNQLRTSFTSGDGEQISLQGLPAGTYYIEVFGASASVANHYALTVDPPPPTSTGDWTVMVYITASDLAPYAADDINEMEAGAASLPGSVQIAALWDQSAKQTTYATGFGTQAAWGTTGRAIIRPDLNMDRDTGIATSFDTSIGEQDTGDPNTLKSFLQWAAQNAPAQHYALVLWDHGEGVGGVNFDNQDFATPDNLTASGIATAVAGSGVHLDLLAFDACKMAMAEVGYTLRNSADVIAGSEEIEGGQGLDYQTALSALRTNPAQVSAQDLAAGIVQSYQASFQHDPAGTDTYSAELTSKYDSFASALKSFDDLALNASTTDADWAAIRTARSAATTFTNSADFRDLGQWMAAIAASGASQSFKDAANAVITAIGNLVVSKTSDRRATTGLSIDLPAPGATVDSSYSANFASFFTATNWSSFLARFTAASNPGVSVGDWAEPNDTLLHAFDLHRLVGAGNRFTGLSLDRPADVDWFRVFIQSAGTGGNGITVVNDAGGGGLVLYIRDAVGNLLAGSGGTSVGLANLPAGEYDIEVAGDGQTIVPRYTLTINAPDTIISGGDWAHGNDTATKAHDLGVVAGNGVFPGLSIDSAVTDWFRFTTPRDELATANTGAITVRPTASGSITVELQDTSGNPIVSATGSGDVRIPFTTGHGASYLLRIYGAPGGYTLLIQDNPLTTVTSTADSGFGSLRQAILNANANPGVDTISFMIGSGPQTINLASPLPTITDPVILDGTSQPGYAGTPLIEINGANAGSTDGISITAGGSVVRGLAVNRFAKSGIVLFGAGYNLIQGDAIGTDTSGTVNRGNNYWGIYVAAGSSNNTIGGTTASFRNVISANGYAGIGLYDASTTGNLVEGNSIGTTADGTKILGNGNRGVDVTGPSNTIGGTAPGAGNVISGNGWDGVGLSGSGAQNNLVAGNRIGTNAAGTIALPNGQQGVAIFGGASFNEVGGTVAGARNLISGNTWAGVGISGAGTDVNFVEGNWVGTDVMGTAALANTQDGVAIYGGASGNMIGGAEATSGNVIASNGWNGVNINGSSTMNNLVVGNRIGTTADGTSALGNASNGVILWGGATGNTVGGTSTGGRNVISGNHNDGVQVYSSGTAGNVLIGNLIGTNVAGTAAVPNTYEGVRITGGASSDTLGGTAAGAGNVISGNGDTGVWIYGTSTSAILVEGNVIGRTADGSAALGNNGAGIYVSGGTTNVAIGGSAAGAGNTIASNGPTTKGAGLVIANDTTGVLVRGNAFFANGGIGIDLGGDGVTINDPGDSDTGANTLQNYPVIAKALTVGSATTITATLNSTPNTAFTVEFFAGNAAGEARVSLGTIQVTTDANGNALISFLPSFAVPGGQWITATATDPANNTSELAASVRVDYDRLVVTMQPPATLTAGSPFSTTVKVENGQGQVDTSYGGTITLAFAKNPGAATLGGTLTLTAANGVAVFVGLTITVAASGYTLQATSGTVPAATTNAIGVSPASPSKLGVTGITSPATAGAAVSLTVTAYDTYSNLTPTYTGTIHFTTTDAQAALPADYAFTATDAGRHTFSVTFKTAGTQAVRATDTAHGSITGVASNIAVNPAAASVLIVSGFSALAAGTPWGFNVQARDPYNNIATGYRGTVHITSTDSKSRLPADYTFTSADAGTHRLVATLETAGSQTLTATDKANSSLKGSQTGIPVYPSWARTFVVAGFPSSTAAGDVHNLTVTAYDLYGNIATGYTGTVHFTTTDSRAELPANYAFTASDAGKHTFQPVFKTAATQAIRATDTLHSTITGVESGIAVAPAAPSVIVVSGFPALVAGTPWGFNAQVRDPFGNIVTGYRGTVHISSSDPKAVLQADYAYTASDAGTHRFVATLETAGTQSLTATDKPTSSVTGSESGIPVSPSWARSFVVNGFPGSTTAGDSHNLTVTAYDLYGNVATGYTGTVHFTTTDSQAILPTNTAFTASDAGKHTFSIAFKTAGAQAVRATDTVHPTITGVETAIAVNAAVAKSVVVFGYPTATTTGVEHPFTVKLLDAYGNVATGYAGTLHFSSDDPLALLPSDWTFTSSDAGQRTFKATFNTKGTHSLKATDSSNSSLSGTETGIVVN